MVDSRRARLLKRLVGLLSGPFVATPLSRLTIHNYVLLGIMLLTHVICYVVLRQELRTEEDNIYFVHRQALAADHSTIVAIRGVMGPFCARPGIYTTDGLCRGDRECHSYLQSLSRVGPYCPLNLFATVSPSLTLPFQHLLPQAGNPARILAGCAPR